MIEDYEKYAQEKELSNIINSVVSRFPHLGSVVNSARYIADPKAKTAYTDGDDVYYSPNFMKNLTYNQKVFLIAHEIMHIAFEHIFRRTKDMHKKRWNIATDAVINARLMDAGLEKIEGCVDRPEALDMSAEEVYKMLEDNNEPQDSQDGSSDGSSGGDSSEGSSSNVGHDDHDVWDEVIERIASGASGEAGDGNESSESESSNKGETDGEDKDNSSSTEGEGMDDDLKEKDNKTESNKDVNGGNSDNKEKDNDKKSKPRDKKKGDKGKDFEKDFNKKNAEIKNKKAQEIFDHLAKEAGQGAGNGSQKFGDVGTPEKPIIDWKRKLKNKFEYNTRRTLSFRRAGEDNGYMSRWENLRNPMMPSTEVLLDTSGSVEDDLLRNFLRELKPLVKDSKLRVGCFDHAFYGFTEIVKKEDIDKLEVKGRGGTSFDTALSSFTRKPEIYKIIFTDGWDNVSNNTFNKGLKNVIWVVYDNKNFKPCVGEVIHVSEKDFSLLVGKDKEISD